MRIAIYSSVAPAVLDHLLWRLSVDLPEVTVAGVLYETNRRRLTLWQRANRCLRLLNDAEFAVYVGHRCGAAISRVFSRALDGVLRFVHAASPSPNGPSPTLNSVVTYWDKRGTEFHITSNLHDDASLAFVRRLGVDLGLIYGTRILLPQLFAIPRRGSINIHKHRVPDYRGGGAPGLWELRDGRTEQTVTIHRVVQEVDAGAVLGERTFTIEPFDTLDSLQTKADVVGVDLIVDVLREEALGGCVERPQPPGGTLIKGCPPHRRYAIERTIRSGRVRWRPTYTRSFLKRVARTVAMTGVAVRNRWRRRVKRFPIIVLYHHLTCDRPKVMGLPTAEFARHVRFLKKHYRIASLRQAIEWLQRGEVDEPTIVLTFDDGYADNFLGLRAIAELERIPVAVCVCTQHVTDESELAHDVRRGERGFRSMNWGQVRYLDRHGFTVVSHSRTHFDCGQGDDTQLVSEIAGSRAELEARLGHLVDAFAFPKGKPTNISSRAHGIALRHYSIVMSASGGANVGPITLPAELRRYVHPESVWELELQIQEILDRAVPPRPIPDNLARFSHLVSGARV
jgi:methionyl-tRNA formyltransferase/peptidoglycan/xylan/chitin deacetylase (PgdA/CDA1 family)